MELENGNEIHALARRLFPICRSITGDGVRKTLEILSELLPELQIHEVPSGTKCFDWTVPMEWNIRDAYIICPDGKKIASFQSNNLHVVGYSTPVEKELTLAELQNHLHSLPDQPTAIPYVTSYYRENWGFCLSHHERTALREGTYRVFIDSELKSGHLTYGELKLPGKSNREIFLSTYVCHPSMGNNELSGPVVTTHLARWLVSKRERHFSYRIVFIPETIGSIVYLSRNLVEMKEKIVAGFNITCVGDDRAFSYLPSRAEHSLADRAALHVLKHLAPDFKRYTFLERGSDERQYCSPGVDLPVASVMRSKYGEFPEYHTSLDDLNFISPEGLYGAYSALKKCVECLEQDHIYRMTVLGEPQLGKRGLYPTTSQKGSTASITAMMNLIAYCDGKMSLLDIAEKINVPMWDLFEITNRLAREKLLERVS